MYDNCHQPSAAKQPLLSDRSDGPLWFERNHLLFWQTFTLSAFVLSIFSCYPTHRFVSSFDCSHEMLMGAFDVCLVFSLQCVRVPMPLAGEGFRVAVGWAVLIPCAILVVVSYVLLYQRYHLKHVHLCFSLLSHVRTSVVLMSCGFVVCE